VHLLCSGFAPPLISLSPGNLPPFPDECLAACDYSIPHPNLIPLILFACPLHECYMANFSFCPFSPVESSPPPKARSTSFFGISIKSYQFFSPSLREWLRPRPFPFFFVSLFSPFSPILKRAFSLALQVFSSPSLIPTQMISNRSFSTQFRDPSCGPPLSYKSVPSLKVLFLDGGFPQSFSQDLDLLLVNRMFSSSDPWHL